MSREPLPRAFYERDALVVARALVGALLVVDGRAARIVETEAYCGPKDLACHARFGRTKRTKTLYGPPGHAYVFLVYGMYDCFNVVCSGEGSGHAVLVRAVELPGAEPKSGAGPGRLTRALGITRADDTADLTVGARVFIAARAGRPKIKASPRVGVAYAGAWADRPWRFFDEASPSVSRPPKSAIGRPAAPRSRPSRP